MDDELTLLDRFAMHALAGAFGRKLAAHEQNSTRRTYDEWERKYVDVPWNPFQEAAEQAYDIAEAMLVERARREELNQS